MAYRRKHGTSRPSTFEDFRSSHTAGGGGGDDSPASTTMSLAAQAIRASAAHRESSLFSESGESMRQRSVSFSQTPVRNEYTSMKSMNESGTNETNGFWGVLARKAKSILEDNSVSQQFDYHCGNEFQIPNTSAGNQFNQPNLSPENSWKSENLTSSLNHIGGTIKNALEEGLTIMENRTADIIQETKKLQIRRKSANFNPRSQVADFAATKDPTPKNSDQEKRLKETRDLANAMAAKAKLLLRELKTVKADLGFAKDRCDQLEEENKLLRESREKGDDIEDDDLIRLQLETLLAEKGRLAHENSIYTRENRFLREVVEYHQLTMQDVVHLDDNIEDVADDGALQISSPYSSSRSASEVHSPAISSPGTTSAPNSPHFPNSNVEPDSSIDAAPALHEETIDSSSKSSPQ